MFIVRRRSSLRRDSKSLPFALRCWLLIAAALLSACSTGVRLGYGYADTLLLYSIDGYVGLTPEQTALVKERSAALIAWHRSTQLRDYAQFIETARRKLAGPVSAADVLEFNHAVNARMAVLGQRAAPDIAEFALTLTPEQLGKMERKLTGDTRKARRELAKTDGRSSLDDRVRRYAERADFWFGTLSAQQLELVRAWLATQPDGTAWWIDERERRQREFLIVLQRIQSERPSEATATQWLRTYFAQLHRPTDAERRNTAEGHRAANADLTAQLLNAATPEQKAALSRKLAGFADDFQALASERAASPPG
jgi:hypothetical protein